MENPEGRSLSGGAKVDLLSAVQQVEEYVQNVLTLDRGFLIPRPVGNFVAPHMYSCKQTIELNADSNYRKVLVIRPDPDTFLLESGKIEDAIFDATVFDQQVDFSFLSSASRITMDETLNNGKDVVKTTTTILGVGGNHFSSNSSKVVPGLKYYSGNYSFEAGKDLAFRVHNPNNLELQAEVSFGWVTSTKTAVQAGVVPGTLAVDEPTDFDLTGNAGWAAFIAQAATQSGIWFAIRFVDAGVRVNSGLEISLQGKDSVTGLDVDFEITRENSVSFTTKSLWDLLGAQVSSVPRAQFLAAARHCVTGLHMLLTNTNPAITKGGTVYGARLPGNTFQELSGDFDSVVNLVSSQVHHDLLSNALANGVSWSYTPEKIQDWLFEQSESSDPYQGNPLNLPYLVLALDGNSGGFGNLGEPKLSFLLNFKVMIEYLTTDPSNWFVESPSSITLFNALASGLAKMNVLSENPSHIENIMKVAKSVATSPEMKQVLMSFLQAGVQVAPMLLTRIFAMV